MTIYILEKDTERCKLDVGCPRALNSSLYSDGTEVDNSGGINMWNITIKVLSVAVGLSVILCLTVLIRRRRQSIRDRGYGTGDVVTFSDIAD